MLTKEQKFLLAQLVRENRDILLRKFGSPGVTKKKKEAIWEAIRQELMGECDLHVSWQPGGDLLRSLYTNNKFFVASCDTTLQD
jgi:hypothetical protein